MLDERHPEPQELVVPASAFVVLRRELTKEVGMLPAVHALHNAGYAAGRDAAAALGGPALRDREASAFWSAIAAYFERRGWGRPVHESPHPGVGLLVADRWAESSSDEDDPEGSCSFSTGFLSGLLSSVADGPVAVLEVSCRTRGDDACRFAFGAADVIHDLYGHLVEGAELPRALAEL